jgi:hypothetical protein
MPETRTDYVPFKVTQDATPNNATRVEFRKGTDKVTIFSEVGATSCSPVGTEGSVIDAGAFMIPAGECQTLKLSARKYGSPPVLYVGNATASTGVTRFDPHPRDQPRGRR